MRRYVVLVSACALAAAGAQFAGCTSSSSPAGSGDAGTGSSGSSSSGSGSSGSSSSGSSSSGSSSSGSSSGGTDAGVDGGLDAGLDAGTDANVDAGTVAVTVNNYATWCSSFTFDIGPNGFGFPGAGSGTEYVAPGTTIHITAQTSAGSAFEIGPDPWISGVLEADSGAPPVEEPDAGGNGASLSIATVVVGAGPTQCIFLCCPFANGTGCTGLTNPCP